MSNVNIKRAVENIKSNTTIYTPIIELVVNAIQATKYDKNNQGEVRIYAIRSEQGELDNSLPEITGFRVTDNGIGFNKENRDSFDTLYSDKKIEQGGKGFGRFICLKYFDDLKVESTYNENGYKIRKFRMGTNNDIIVDESVAPTEEKQTGSTITIANKKKTVSLNKKLSTIARGLVEILLPYFITNDYTCPTIYLSEENKDDEIVLNDYINSKNAIIKEINISKNNFSLPQKTKQKQFFNIRVFKFYTPKNKVSKISLVADRREVTETSTHNYIPEFADEFYDNHTLATERNYILKTYVFSEYLNSTVSLERGDFDFSKNDSLTFPISQEEIEENAADLTKESVIDQIQTRQDKKLHRIKTYIDNEAPWHRTISNAIDYTKFPYNSSDEEIEARLQREKFEQEQRIRNEVRAILENDDLQKVKDSVPAIVAKISENSKNDLAHYIALRKKVLDLFRKSLESDMNGKYSSEGYVHDIIFPTKKDSENTNTDAHNLWIIDERLNFTNYLSSDVPLNGGRTERPDIIAYDNRVAFRGENTASNPVTIFEFKKPERDDFTRPSSKEDPVQQIIRYVNSIRAGKFKTPEGIKIQIAPNTPFYGYVVCGLTHKVEEWIQFEKNFKPMPDGMGWFQWFENINLYVEVLSWDKLLSDAEMRNKVFFHKLGIENV